MLRYAASALAKYIPFKSFFCRRREQREDPEVGAPHPVPQQQQHVPQLQPHDQVQHHHQYPPPPPPPQLDIFMSDAEEEDEEQQEEALPSPTYRHIEVQTDTIPPPLLPPMSGTGHPGYRTPKDEICDIFPPAEIATTSSNNSSNTSGFCDGEEEYSSSEDNKYDNSSEEEEDEDDYDPSDYYYLQETVTHVSRYGRPAQVPQWMASVRQ